ncbi:hypothetical protein B0H17DRAFT_1178006 [Mycena rosella]|uniref:Uncharacterized protein n=1 Tax=Mycena rosella TaxID=1033263 RepID=A0AAD7DNU1_MYCRO|nr:hypothetical protein B0H17DRAFT_1178006 [Mycena rosella]
MLRQRRETSRINAYLPADSLAGSVSSRDLQRFGLYLRASGVEHEVEGDVQEGERGAVVTAALRSEEVPDVRGIESVGEVREEVEPRDEGEDECGGNEPALGKRKITVERPLTHIMTGPRRKNRLFQWSRMYDADGENDARQLEDYRVDDLLCGAQRKATTRKTLTRLVLEEYAAGFEPSYIAEIAEITAEVAPSRHIPTPAAPGNGTCSKGLELLNCSAGGRTVQSGSILRSSLLLEQGKLYPAPQPGLLDILQMLKYIYKDFVADTLAED